MPQLVVGESYQVTVKSIIKSGAVVELQPGWTELIHISNMSSGFVSNVEDYVKVGCTYEAKAKEGKVKPVELSLSHLNLGPKSLKQSVPSKPNQSGKNYSSKPKPTLDDMIAKSQKDLEDKFSSSRMTNERIRYKKNKKGGN